VYTEAPGFPPVLVLSDRSRFEVLSHLLALFVCVLLP
jgi:hypothetical protein